MSRSIRIDEAVYRKLQTMAGTYNLGFCTPNDVLKRMLNGVEPYERNRGEIAPRRWKKKLHVTLNPQHLEAM